MGLYDLRKAVLGINRYALWQIENGQTNVWKHLVVTCKGTILKLYINGISTTYIGGKGCNPPTTTQNIGYLIIGKGYNGLIDDFVMYNKNLSITEISQLYNLAPCCK